LALTCLWVSLSAFAATARDTSRDTFKEERELFLQAYASVDAALPSKAGQSNGSEHEDGRKLRDYPLYPYLQAARIRHALSDPTADLAIVDQRADAFVTQHGQEPVGRDFRRAWLASLGERQQWDKFLQYYSDDLNDEILRCMSFDARIALARTDDLAAAVATAWLTPRSLLACEGGFNWLRAQQKLTPELIEQRIRMALRENNVAFARQLIPTLPAERATPMQQWAQLLENPQRGFNALLTTPAATVDPEALLAGWTRLARTNRDVALQRYDDLIRVRGLNATAASPFAVALALSLAWDRRPEALTYFDKVIAVDLDERALEWQTRAALWAGDWQRVASTIATMPSTQRELARWRYWAARAAEQRKDLTLARTLYSSVLADDNYYSAMAAARLDQTVEPHPQKLVTDEEQLKQLQQLPAMLRARELFLSAMRPQALAEWQHAYTMLSAQTRPHTVTLATRWGWYEQAIATATQHRIFNDYELLYPRPYDAEVSAAAKLTQLEPELIYSVMRQESLYRADAVSPAGAMGLLQMMPETARRTAQNWKRTRPKTDDLLIPATNVTLGAGQLRMLIDRFRGQTVVALASYNAGPAAAARWLPGEAIESDIWIENIPYNETRTYVQRILWHSVVFGWLETGKPQQTESWMARVAPLNDSTLLGAR
jgi:soluble lytic murein transglycosylase